MTYFRILAPIVFLGLSACAGLNARLPDIQSTAVSLEQSQQADIALERYKTLNARLQNVGRRVLIANAELCERRSRDFGLQALRLKDMPKELRKVAKANWGLDEKPRIIYAPDGRSDLIGTYLQRDGHAIDPQSRLAALEGVITDLPSQPICNFPLRLIYTPTINAYANGRKIFVTSGMMDFTNDDELALIIGHELGHNTQGHIRKIVQNRILSLGRATHTRQFESESDYVGLYYMARAGYDINVAPQFWRNLAKVSIKSLETAKSHPIIPERYVRLGAAIAEIEAKRASGEPLIPNMQTGAGLSLNQQSGGAHDAP